jgi:RNA polymerase sigma factor (sigma-70 family)
LIRVTTEAVFRDLRERLQRLLRRRGRTRDDAEDLIQEAFLRLQQYYEKGGEVRQQEAFLVRTTLRLSINARRDEHKDLYIAEPVESLEIADTAPLPEDFVALEERLQAMKRALATLSASTRDAYVLNRVDGLTYSQIAKLHGLTTKAVERRIARAMLALSNQEHAT